VEGHVERIAPGMLGAVFCATSRDSIMTEVEYREELWRRINSPIQTMDGMRARTPREKDLIAALIYLREGPDVFMRELNAEKIVAALVAWRYPGP
jgi:hypothetical protein